MEKIIQRRSFKTKTGYCHILPDKIVITYDGIIGTVVEVAGGRNIVWIQVIYGAISIVSFYFAYDIYKTGHYVQTGIWAFIGLYLVYNIIRSLNISARPVIDRQRIREVRFNIGEPGLTRARFEVMFTDTRGQLKKRMIMMPGSLSGGQMETERALKIMREENLLRSS